MQTVTYRLTVADLVDARTYAYNSLPFVRVVRLVPFVWILGCLLRGAYVVLQRDWDEIVGLAGLLFVGLALIVWLFLGNRWLLPRSARSQLARDKRLQGDVAVSWDGERIVSAVTHGESRWPWSDLHQWQESPGGLLLWHSDRTYLYLPKACLTLEQLAEIREQLIRAVGRPGKRRR